MASRIFCNNCGYEATGEDLEAVEAVVEEDGGFLDVDYVDGEVYEYDCPDCNSTECEVEI